MCGTPIVSVDVGQAPLALRRIPDLDLIAPDRSPETLALLMEGVLDLQPCEERSAHLAAAVAEMFGLAMIIGAYAMGLVLSDTKLAHYLEEQTTSIYHVFVPVFFVVLGMLVDFSAMRGAMAWWWAR